MRVLLDESVPRDLGFALVGHFVRTVQTMGWAGLSNGKLLAVMLTENFETLVTCDQNLEYQQGMDLPVSLIVVVIPNTRVSTVMPLASACPTHRLHGTDEVTNKSKAEIAWH